MGTDVAHLYQRNVLLRLQGKPSLGLKKGISESVSTTMTIHSLIIKPSRILSAPLQDAEDIGFAVFEDFCIRAPRQNALCVRTFKQVLCRIRKPTSQLSKNFWHGISSVKWLAKRGCFGRSQIVGFLVNVRLWAPTSRNTSSSTARGDVAVVWQCKHTH